MHHRFNKIFVVLAVVSAMTLSAQSPRISDHNVIGWYNLFGNISVSDDVTVHAEYQFRRNEIVSEWQQSLLRVGVGYKVSDEVQLRAGYAWAETFPYGDIPLNGFGKDFTEHRIFQAVLISGNAGKVALSHRFVTEQRWIGRYTSLELASEDDFTFVNRGRYMFRAQLQLNAKWYAAIYDEVFVGFGKNVGENVFDQNRIGALMGRNLGKVRIEAGYLNQILQFGRRIQGKNVFQYNNGLIINMIANVDFRKPATSTE